MFILHFYLSVLCGPTVTKFEYCVPWISRKNYDIFIISLFIFTDIFANYFSNISKLKNFFRPLYALYIMVFVYGIK